MNGHKKRLRLKKNTAAKKGNLVLKLVKDRKTLFFLTSEIPDDFNKPTDILFQSTGKQVKNDVSASTEGRPLTPTPR